MPSARTAIAVTAAGLAAGLLIAAATQALGPLGAIAPVATLAGALLLRLPALAVALLLGGAVLIEKESSGILPLSGEIDSIVLAGLTPADILIALGLGGVLLRFAIERESDRPRLPAPLTAPLALLVVAVLAGIAVGHYSTAGAPAGDLLHRAATPLFLVAVPLIVVNVVRDTRALLAFAAVAAALAAFKGASGLYASLGGLGRPLEGGSISYLNPAPNLLMLSLVLGAAAAIVRRVRLPAWVLAGAPLALLALVLSYRRSFWIAAAFTLVIVVIVASRRRGRATAALAGIALALTLGATAIVGSSDPSASPLATRAKTLTPEGLGTNRGDRYRIDERRNVIATLREEPLTGVGLGVPWRAHHPLAESHDRRYVHFAVLWFWLSFGLLGVVAYLAVLGTALWAALNVWRRHPNGTVKIAALACFGGILGLLVTELTATFTGVEPRASLLIGGMLGWIAAAWADLPEHRRERSRPGALPG